MNRILSLPLVLASVIASESLGAQDYFPLRPGNKWYYDWNGSEITLKVDSKPHEFNGNTYWAIVDSTPEVVYDSSRIVFEGTTYWIYRKARLGMPIATMFYRKDADGNIYSYDDELNIESLLIPKQIKKGDMWMSSDGRVEYKIISRKETFKSKSSVFNDCLVISTKVLRPRYHEHSFDPSAVFLHYYCEGVGYVGSKPEEKFGMALLKWEISNDR
ncbi:hypothetical protein [Chryseolinea sp. H1M3-3]|uniref:hypothetical protein n=1 Tax=Chryseolinea sp. H1M3-3 TaxID=3034144 RepID=UPI0023EE1295|nr:hypothetical protein [Chryseolinea sp. H1M3-3]